MILYSIAVPTFLNHTCTFVCYLWINFLLQIQYSASIQANVANTVTVNWVTSIGDNEMDVFTVRNTISNSAYTRDARKSPLAAAIIDKIIDLFN